MCTDDYIYSFSDGAEAASTEILISERSTHMCWVKDVDIEKGQIQVEIG